MFGDHWRRTVVDKQARDQCFEGESGLFSRHGRAEHCTTTRTCRSMEINRMAHRTIHQVFQVNFYRVAHAYSVEWAGHLAIERPIVISCSIRELTFDFDGFEIDAHSLGFTDTHLGLGRDFARVADDVSAGCGRVVDNNWPTDHDIAACSCSGGCITEGSTAGHLKGSDHAGF